MSGGSESSGSALPHFLFLPVISVAVLTAVLSAGTLAEPTMRDWSFTTGSEAGRREGEGDWIYSMKRKELRGRNKINQQWRVTHRSRDAPWPPVPSVGPDGHIAAVYPGSPKPQDSPGADSHCVRSAPIVYANVCGDRDDERKDTKYQKPDHTQLHHYIMELYFLRHTHFPRIHSGRFLISQN